MDEAIRAAVWRGVAVHRSGVWCCLLATLAVPAVFLPAACALILALLVAWIGVLIAALGAPRGSALRWRLLRAAAWTVVAVALQTFALLMRARLVRYAALPWSFQIPVWLALGTSVWLVLGAWLQLAARGGRSTLAPRLRLLQRVCVGGLAVIATASLVDAPASWFPALALSAWDRLEATAVPLPHWLFSGAVFGAFLVALGWYLFAIDALVPPKQAPERAQQA